MGRKKKTEPLKEGIKPYNKGIITHAEGITPYHAEIIDNYFNNGFNKSKAVQEVRPEVNSSSAVALCNSVLKKAENQDYIKAKQEELKAVANINNYNILQELITIAYNDPTKYLELTPQQLKELPANERRALQSINIKKRKYKDRQGQEVIEETVTVKTVDKIKSLDMIAKHIGFYAEDNKQKSPIIDITKLSTEDQKALLRIFQHIDKPLQD